MTSYITSANERIACEPFEVRTPQVAVKSGFAVIKQKTELTALRVLFPCQGFPQDISPGDLVYVRGEFMNATWAVDVYEIEGTKFILVPFNAVLLVSEQ